MQTRDTSPSPTHECKCGTTTPDSSGELCATCQNYRQIFGVAPTNDDHERAVTVEPVCGHYELRKHKDGEIDERTTMYGERHAHRRRREYQGILDHVRNAERLRDD